MKLYYTCILSEHLAQNLPQYYSALYCSILDVYCIPYIQREAEIERERDDSPPT